MSGIATHATLNAPVLSTVSEIPRWSSRFYGPAMATLLYTIPRHSPLLDHLSN